MIRMTFEIVNTGSKSVSLHSGVPGLRRNGGLHKRWIKHWVCI